MLRLVTKPAEEPLSLAETKLHLRVDLDDDDALISALIAAARQVCETEQRRALITSTWELTLDGFPYWSAALPFAHPHGTAYSLERPRANTRQKIHLDRPPLQSVESITYVGPAGSTVTLDPSKYRVVPGSPGLVVPAYGLTWPSTRLQPEAVSIIFVSGYGGAADVPDSTKVAMRLLIGHWYENREAVVTGTIAAELPIAVKALLAAEDWGSYS